MRPTRQLSTNGPGGNPAMILGYAYNNTLDGSILARVVPEPSTWALPTMGEILPGLGAARRRMTQAA